jgi:hypothetical protein
MCDVLLPPGVSQMWAVLLPPDVNQMCAVLLPPGVNQMWTVLLPPGVNQMCAVLLPPGVNQMWAVLLPPGVNPIAVIYIYNPILDKLLEYKRNWIQHVNRMPRNRLPRVMKHYCLTGRRSQGRLLKRFLDTWDRNGSTRGPAAWQMYDYDDDHVCSRVVLEKLTGSQLVKKFPVFYGTR